MKKIIKRLITRLLWDSVQEIMQPLIENELSPAVCFFIDGKLIEARNMIFVPPIGSEVWIKDMDEKAFKVERMEIVSPTGYSIYLHGQYTK